MMPSKDTNDTKDKARFSHQRLRAIVLCAVIAGAGLHSITAAHAETEATTYYVAPGGNDGGACNSTAAPCGTIQAAVNKAASSDTIQIAAGTYTFSVDQCGSGVNAVVCIAEKSLTLIGAGAGATIIDGQQGRRGVAVLGAGVKPFVRVQNLTIRNGLAGPFGGYAATGQSQGGGMLVNNASVALSNLQFLNNRSVGVDVGAGAGGIGAGGGLSILWVPGQLPSQDNVLENIVFDGNQAAGSGGSVRGGEAQGGALFTYYARVNASGLTVRNNVAQAGNSGGAGSTPDGQEADGLGGGIAAQEASNVTITSSTFTNNQARGGNAGQSGGNAFGGGVFAERASLSLTSLDLRENEAVGGNGTTGGIGGGGAISHDSTTMGLARSTAINNSSSGGNGNTAGAAGGGAIYITRFTNNGATSSIVNTIIANNTTRQGSGASAGGGGGGIWVQGLPLNLTHVTLAYNSAGAGMLGQAMIVNDFGAPTPSTTDLNFTIVANHTGSSAAIVVEGGNTLNLNRGLWAANGANTSTFGGAATINGGASMLGAGSAGFASAGAPNYDYRITGGSPALDQATSSTTPIDFEGINRPQGSASDIGADEYFILPDNLRPYAYIATIIK